MRMTKLSVVRKSFGSYIIEPVVKLVARTTVTPNTISWIGFILAVGAAALITSGHLIVAGLGVLVAGYFDLLDGALARRTNRATAFGGVLDSTLDRLSEAALLLGVLGLFLLSGEKYTAFLSQGWSIVLVFIALLGSLLVSYIRARAETAGVDCQVGWCTRGERVVMLVLGLLVNQLVVALMIIAAFSFIAVAQRLIYVGQGTRVIKTKG